MKHPSRRPRSGVACGSPVTTLVPRVVPPASAIALSSDNVIECDHAPNECCSYETVARFGRSPVRTLQHHVVAIPPVVRRHGDWWGTRRRRYGAADALILSLRLLVDRHGPRTEALGVDGGLRRSLDGRPRYRHRRRDRHRRRRHRLDRDRHRRRRHWLDRDRRRRHWLGRDRHGIGRAGHGDRRSDWGVR